VTQVTEGTRAIEGGAQAGPTIIASELTAEQRRMMDGVKWLAHDRLDLFVMLVLNRTKLVPRFHRPMCDFIAVPIMSHYGRKQIEGPTDWEGEATTDYPRVTVDRGLMFRHLEGSRGCLKSTCGMLGAALWVPAEFDPDSSFMGVLGTQPLADYQATEIEQHLLTNPRFRYLYGDWKQNDANLPWTLRAKTYSIRGQPSKNPSLVMTSVGADLTGLHPDFIVLDDPINEKNYQSVVELARIEQFHDALFALDPVAMWVYGTRWDQNDLYGKRILTELADHYDVWIRGARNPDGSLTLPELIDERKLDAKLKLLGRYLFYSQMMNMVVPRSEHPLRGDLIKRYQPGEVPAREKMMTFLWGDAAGARETGNWAFPVVGLTRDEATDEIHMWLLDYEKGPQTPARAASTFCRLWWKHKPNESGFENVGIAQGFIDVNLVPEMRRQSIHKRLNETRPGGISKKARVMDVENSLGSMIERGVVHAPQDAPAFWSEVAMFPSGTYDILDMMAAILKFAFEHQCFPASSKAEERPRSSDYDMLMRDAERILRADRRREAARMGRRFEPVMCEALREVFRDASEPGGGESNHGWTEMNTDLRDQRVQSPESRIQSPELAEAE
jgi:hypothetical protein